MMIICSFLCKGIRLADSIKVLVSILTDIKLHIDSLRVGLISTNKMFEDYIPI